MRDGWLTVHTVSHHHGFHRVKPSFVPAPPFSSHNSVHIHASPIQMRITSVRSDGLRSLEEKASFSNERRRPRPFPLGQMVPANFPLHAQLAKEMFASTIKSVYILRIKAKLIVGYLSIRNCIQSCVYLQRYFRNIYTRIIHDSVY